MDTYTPYPYRLSQPATPCLRRILPPSSVRVLTGLPYAYRSPRNKLDLYLPDRSNFPVALFVHGGSWSAGDKATYAHVGTFLARHGIGAVVPNYRLSPEVRHPAHVEDVAAAFAWMWRNIPTYGGDPGRLSVFGHSAGGHLVSLLATDAGHLRPWGLAPSNIQGVVAVSGVYRINFTLAFYGVAHVFRGVDKAAASPLTHVKAGCPPFLILYAQRDTWTLAGQARRLHARVQAHGGWSRLVSVAGENHDSIIHNATVPGSAHVRQIVRFLLDG
jgi:acetyl esterase/lipase